METQTAILAVFDQIEEDFVLSQTLRAYRRKFDSITPSRARTYSEPRPGTTADVCAFGIELTYPDASSLVRFARDRQIEPEVAARACSRKPRVATAACHCALTQLLNCAALDVVSACQSSFDEGYQVRCVFRCDCFRVECRMDLREERGPIVAVTGTGLGTGMAHGGHNGATRATTKRQENGLVQRKSLRS